MARIAASRSVLQVMHGRSAFTPVSSSERDAVGQLIRNAAFNTADLGKVAEAVKQAGFVAEDEDMLDIIAEKVSAVPGLALGCSVRTGLQYFSHALHYLPQGIWDDMSEGRNMLSLVEHFL